ncbi:MFS transporter [Achromobacter aegrifaciens]|uniref:MFS transporter n=1 Tax=Achromobacter aegrifaciens TaxID=1287736 RepID=UPI001FCC86FB|nr:MFS transporter [Achromobacter aegrifaciens]
MLAVCTAALILPLSFSGGAIATPAIGRDLGGHAQALGWITNAFMLSFGSLLMAAGTLADAYGRKRLFVAGVALFALVSVALAFAPTVAWLDGLRALQGAGAAAALAGGAASLAHACPGPARTRACGLLGASFGAGLALGPMLAGLLIDSLGWRSVFLSSAAVGAMALAVALPRMQESRDPQAGPLDWAGSLTFTGALALLTWGILEMPAARGASALAWRLLAAAALCLLAFVAIERRVRRPMLDLTLLRYPRFVGVQMLPVATCYCYVVLLVLLPIRFIGIEGRSEASAGLAMAALSAPLLFMPAVAVWTMRWMSAGRSCALGLLAAALGLYWLSRIGVEHAPQAALWPMLLIGAGTGLPWGLMDGLSMSVAPPERAGMAAGIFSTTRVAGEGIALASVNALLTFLIAHRLGADPGAAAQYLAAGDMAQTLVHQPGAAPALLRQAYDDAFRQLLHALMAITLACATVVALFLDAPRSQTLQARMP